MDIEKMVTFLPKYLSEYLSALFLTLQNPTLRFVPSELPKKPKETTRTAGEHSNKINGVELNPKLISFVILSIFIGSLLQGFTPNHTPIRELPTLIIIVIAMWLFISSSFFVIFRLLGGKGGFIATISISLQLIASIYVIASLISLIATVLFFANDTDFFNSFLVYLITQLFLLSIYLPLALKALHFSSGSKVNIGFVVAITLSILFFLIIGTRFVIGSSMSGTFTQIFGTLP